VPEISARDCPGKVSMALSLRALSLRALSLSGFWKTVPKEASNFQGRPESHYADGWTRINTIFAHFKNESVQP
jgi:hypothetical protein